MRSRDRGNDVTCTGPLPDYIYRCLTHRKQVLELDTWALPSFNKLLRPANLRSKNPSNPKSRSEARMARLQPSYESRGFPYREIVWIPEITRYP